MKRLVLLSGLILAGCRTPTVPVEQHPALSVGTKPKIVVSRYAQFAPPGINVADLRQVTAIIDPYLEVSPGVKATNAAVVLYKSQGTNAAIPAAIMLNTRVKTMFYVLPGMWNFYATAVIGTNSSDPSNLVTVNVK